MSTTPSAPAPAPASSGSLPKPVILRDYSKAIFFYPLLVYSIIAFIVAAVHEIDNAGDTIAYLGVIWIFMFFANLFVNAFDFSAGKFLVLFLGTIAVVLIIIVILIANPPEVDLPNATTIDEALDPQLGARFFGFFSLALGIILLLVLAQAQFHYVKIEQNELYVRGIEGSAERFPTHGLTIKKEISDVFEYISMGAGSITLITDKGKNIKLETVMLINKKEKAIDEILSTTLVKHV